MTPVRDNPDAIRAAEMVFEGTRWRPSDQEVNELANNMLMVEQRGLGRLNERLVAGGRKVWDTIAEHNFACGLLQHHGVGTRLAYEQDEFHGRKLERPIDFMLDKQGTEFWIQMKKLSVTERENRQDNALKRIKQLAQAIPLGKFFSCHLSEDFDSTGVEPLVAFIASIAAGSVDDEEHYYPSRSRAKAKVALWKPNRLKLDCLTLGLSGDMNMVRVTAESREQIRRSLENASGAFSWDTDEGCINVIAMEIGSPHGLIDVGEAVFGDEVGLPRGRRCPRKGNGFFSDPRFCSKIAAVIAVRRVEHSPTSAYTKVLFLNDKFRGRMPQIQTVLGFDQVIESDELILDPNE